MNADRIALKTVLRAVLDNFERRLNEIIRSDSAPYIKRRELLLNFNFLKSSTTKYLVLLRVNSEINETTLINKTISSKDLDISPLKMMLDKVNKIINDILSDMYASNKNISFHESNNIYLNKGDITFTTPDGVDYYRYTGKKLLLYRRNMFCIILRHRYLCNFKIKSIHFKNMPVSYSDLVIRKYVTTFNGSQGLQDIIYEITHLYYYAIFLSVIYELGQLEKSYNFVINRCDDNSCISIDFPPGYEPFNKFFFRFNLNNCYFISSMPLYKEDLETLEYARFVFTQYTDIRPIINEVHKRLFVTRILKYKQYLMNMYSFCNFTPFIVKSAEDCRKHYIKIKLTDTDYIFVDIDPLTGIPLQRDVEREIFQNKIRSSKLVPMIQAMYTKAYENDADYLFNYSVVSSVAPDFSTTLLKLDPLPLIRVSDVANGDFFDYRLISHSTSIHSDLIGMCFLGGFKISLMLQLEKVLSDVCIVTSKSRDEIHMHIQKFDIIKLKIMHFGGWKLTFPALPCHQLRTFNVTFTSNEFPTNFPYLLKDLLVQYSKFQRFVYELNRAVEVSYTQSRLSFLDHFNYSFHNENVRMNILFNIKGDVDLYDKNDSILIHSRRFIPKFLCKLNVACPITSRLLDDLSESPKITERSRTLFAIILNKVNGTIELFKENRGWTVIGSKAFHMIYKKEYSICLVYSNFKQYSAFLPILDKYQLLRIALFPIKSQVVMSEKDRVFRIDRLTFDLLKEFTSCVEFFFDTYEYLMNIGFEETSRNIEKGEFNARLNLRYTEIHVSIYDRKRVFSVVGRNEISERLSRYFDKVNKDQSSFDDALAILCSFKSDSIGPDEALNIVNNYRIGI